MKRSVKSRRGVEPQRTKAMKVFLGQAKNEADRMRIVLAVHEIEEQVTDYLKREATKAKREAEKERELLIASLVSAEPFQIGNKWGLRHKGCIVVTPIYRNVKYPVGR